MTSRGPIQQGARHTCTLVGFALLGCGGIVDFGPEGTDLGSAAAGSGASGGSTSSPMNVGVGGGTPASGGAPVAPADVLAEPHEFCTSVCGSDVESPCALQAGCHPGMCLAQAGEWDAVVREVFAACVHGGTLCTETIQACMLDSLFPPTETLRIHNLTVAHLGVGAPRSVYAGAWVPGGKERLLAAVATQEDEVLFSWPEPWAGDVGATFYAWLDVDLDGLCESGSDLFGYGVSVWNGSFYHPAYDAYIGAYFDDGEAACPILGYGGAGVSGPP